MFSYRHHHRNCIPSYLNPPPPAQAPPPHARNGRTHHFTPRKNQTPLTKEKDSDPIATTILKGIANGIFTFEDYQAWKDNGTYPGGLKDGGRAGYQMGGDVMQEQMNITETMTEGMGNPAQAQTQAPNEDFTYDELRSRLPREIKNDIVSLIAVSKQALLDFSNTSTQQDVDNFNQQYNVNLVLPQER